MLSFTRFFKSRPFWKVRMTPKIPDVPVELSCPYFDEIPPGIIVQRAILNQPAIKPTQKKSHLLRRLSLTVSISVVMYVLYKNAWNHTNVENTGSSESKVMNMLLVDKQNDKFTRKDRL